MKKRIHTHSVFGDTRLESRFDTLLSISSRRLNSSIGKAQPNWASTKATYRFWDNKSVHPEALIAYQFSKIEAGWGAEKMLLQVCDWTELDYTGSRSAATLGPLSYKRQRGFHLYNSMIVSHLGCPLGLLKQSYHTRTDANFGTSKSQCNQRILADKETAHWVEHFQRGQDLVTAREDLQMVFVADREADFMELFAQRTVERMHFIIRSQHDRKLSDGASNLVPRVNTWPVQGIYEAQVMHSKTRKMRKARLEVRFGALEVQLSKPLPQKKGLPAMRLFVVDVRETGNQDEAIHWRLLTTLPVESFAQAAIVIQYYIWRWLIERFHFLLKSGGAAVEKLQLATPQRLKNAITTFSLAAMDAFKLRYLAQNNPDENIYSLGISEVEHKVLYTYAHKKLGLTTGFDPDNPPSIKEYCITLGRIAGFFPSKKQTIPGLLILTRARERLDTLVDAYLTFQ